jgi:Ca2+-transporting ATPase
MVNKITVVARSTPSIKLKIVRALKEQGEVVAVTGDGVNDAPAIKHADIGIAMGINGSEITKEAADVILLDDSFATVVKAISFGRNVYRNLQRFILFQLSVNLSALLFIVICGSDSYKRMAFIQKQIGHVNEHESD